MGLSFIKMFILFQLIALISLQSRADQRNLGLSTFTGGLNPVGLLGAVKLASDASKLIPGDPKALVDTTFKAIENYSPIVLPQSSSGELAIDETIKLDDRQLKLHLPAERVTHLIKMAGLDSKNVDWKLYRFPLTLHQLKTILSTHHKGPSSSRLSILPMDSYIPKIMSSLDRLSDGYYRLFEKFIESDMDLDEFMEYVDQLNQVDEGMIILPVGIKSGALAKPPGSIVLLGLGKFPADRKQTEPPSIVPTILVGSVGQVSPLQYKPDPVVEESVTSTSSPETVVMETPKIESETPSPTILEVSESSQPEPNVPVATSSLTSGPGADTSINNAPIGPDRISSQSFASSSSSSSAQSQSTFFPSNPQPSSSNFHPPPPRPMQRPPQPRPNFRPPPQSFDGRPSPQQFQPPPPNLRPLPRPRMDNQG